MLTKFDKFVKLITESRLHIPSMKLKNMEAYHGSTINYKDGDRTIGRFDTRYSDWDAVWFASKEYVAIEFAEQWENDESVTAIYKVKINCKKVANIDYELSQELSEYWGYEDFREAIPMLTNKGFRGWIVPGSIGDMTYDDYAMFYPAEDVEIISVSLKLKGNWSKDMSLEEADEILDDLESKSKL